MIFDNKLDMAEVKTISVLYAIPELVLIKRWEYLLEKFNEAPPIKFIPFLSSNNTDNLSAKELKFIREWWTYTHD